MAKKILSDVRSEPVLYTLFGISCHLKDYRLSFLLNRKLELEFIKLDDFREFSFYSCSQEDCFNEYFLLANRGPETILLPELKQTDFLLLVEGPFKKQQKDDLLENIRTIPNVLTSFEIRFSTIKNHETFLTDLEMHCMNIRKETKIKYSPIK
ncbi:MAG: IPExxxVDY family protein [Bacteroidales bacterium]|nr:IPExxxVDY family protein [Bacteroidales bacterium]